MLVCAHSLHAPVRDDGARRCLFGGGSRVNFGTNSPRFFAVLAVCAIDGVFLYNIGDACFDLPTPTNYHHHAKERALRIENVKLVRRFFVFSFFRFFRFATFRVDGAAAAVVAVPVGTVFACVECVSMRVFEIFNF